MKRKKTMLLFDHYNIVRLYQEGAKGFKQLCSKEDYEILSVNEIKRNANIHLVALHENFLDVFPEVYKLVLKGEAVLYGENQRIKRRFHPEFFQALEENKPFGSSSELEKKIVFFTTPHEFLRYFPVPQRKDNFFHILQNIDKNCQPLYFTDVYESLETLTNAIIIVNPSVVEEGNSLFDDFIAGAYNQVKKENNLSIGFVRKDYQGKELSYDILMRKWYPHKQLFQVWETILQYPSIDKTTIRKRLPKGIVGKKLLPTLEAKKDALSNDLLPKLYDYEF